jgi:hypothetical protein
MVRRILGSLVSVDGTDAHRVEFSRTMEQWQALEDEMFKGTFLTEKEKEDIGSR